MAADGYGLGIWTLIASNIDNTVTNPLNNLVQIHSLHTVKPRASVKLSSTF